MRHFALFTLICFSCLTLTPIITAATTQDRHFVKNYLIDYGYLELEHTRQAFKRSLRQFQRENNIETSGRITPELLQLIDDRIMVIDYLQNFNYLKRGERSPSAIALAVTQLQTNSGTLALTSNIDTPTINFVKTHSRGFAEPILLDS